MKQRINNNIVANRKGLLKGVIIAYAYTYSYIELVGRFSYTALVVVLSSEKLE